MTLLPNVLSSDSLNRYSVDYYKDPKLEWMIRLEGQELFEGNGVVQSPFHDKILYVTSRKGVLFAISSLDGSVIQVVTPEARTYSQEGTTQTYDMHCFSSVAFGELSTGKQFLVYSIVDQPSVEELSSTGPKT